MKKIIVLIIILFSLTGCYDNIELSNISIINAIGIDYKDNKYVVTYEIISDDKDNKLSYTITGESSNIIDAFTETNYRVAKEPYFAHLKLVIISENILNNNFKEVLDYLFYNNEIRDEFYLLVTDDNPENILNNVNNLEPVASNYITNLLNTEKYNNSIVSDDTFKIVMSKLLSNKEDIILNKITIKDNKIALDNSYMFNNYEYITTLNKNESSLYNLLMKSTTSTVISIDNNNAFKINKSKKDIDITKDEIIINLNLDIELLNNSDINIKKYINNELLLFINKLQDNNCDILGFRDLYYKKYNKDNYNLWKYANVIINTNINNKMGAYINE